MPDTAAVVLAAGGSSRMGVPKQGLELDGTPLVRRAAEAACGAGCRPVVVVLGACADEVGRRLDGLPVLVVENARWEAGLGSSIRAGVAAAIAAAPEIEGVLLALADQALVDAAALMRLCRTARSSRHPVAASRYAGTIGVPAWFARDFLPRLLALDPAEGCKRLLRAHAHETAIVDCPEAGFDVDTPEDYARLLLRTAAGDVGESSAGRCDRVRDPD